MEQWILVIEPDRRQSAKLAMLARNQLHVETVIVASVHDAMQILDERVPDLLLTSAVLLPRDEATLTERLRQLAAAGMKVSTLRIPILEAPTRRLLGPQKGPGNRLRPVVHGLRSQDACDPFVFGIQLNAHLERLASEQPAVAASPPARRAPAAPPSGPAKAGHDVPREPTAPQTAEPVTIVRPEQTERAVEPTRARTRPAEWRTLLSALQRDLDRMKTENVESLPPTEKVITQLVPQPPRAVAQPRAQQTPASPQPAAAPIQPQPVTAQPPAVAGPAANAPRGKKRKSPPPAQDEWGLFDPNQCGLAALRTKLDEIKNPQK